MRRRLLYPVEDCGGGMAVEFALIAPFLAAMMLMVVDAGMAYVNSMRLAQVAHFGTQYAIQHPDSFNASALVTAIQTYQPMAGATIDTPTQTIGCISGSTVTATAITATCADGTKAGTFVTITARSTYRPMFSSFLGNSINQVRSMTVRTK